jgi:RNA polymerase sigma-70 factor (ECF subfamily)
VIQAAIAALHTEEASDWGEIAILYGELARATGSPVVEINRAAATAEAGNPEGALAIIDQLNLSDYRYLHSTRAEILWRLGRLDDARAAYARALALVHDEAERRLFTKRLDELGRTEHGAPT